jgi:transcriptional regulator
MYIPKAFRVEDSQQVEAFLTDNPFAILITADDGNINATHLPILRFKDGKLYGHMARANPQADVAETASVLVIFSGPHGYITPQWYRSDHNLPTWNYGAVHCRGRIVFIEDPSRVWSLLKEMVELLEGSGGWRLSEGKGHQKLVAAIRFFEFIPTKVEAKFKLSQNKKPEDILGVIEGLTATGSTNVAEFMRRIISCKRHS